MRPSLSVDPTASVTASSSSGGFPWFKALAGCGCVAVVGFVLISVGVSYFAFSTVTTAAAIAEGRPKGESFGESIGYLLQGSENKNSGSAGEQSGDATRAHDASTSSRDRTLEELFDALDQPISTSQARAYIAAMNDWAASSEVRQITEQLDTNQKIAEDGDGLLAGLKRMRAVKGTLDRGHAVGMAFNKHIEEHGGRAFEERLLQFRLIHRVTSVGNKHNANKEPWSDAVADALLNDHDEQRPNYLKFRQIVVDAHKDTGFDPSELSEEERNTYADALANQFLLITGAINRDTLETWKALSVEERKQIHDQFNAPHQLFSSAMALATGGERSSLVFYGFFGI